MPTILHFIREGDWARAQAQGELRPASLAEEGFIHCSTPNQALGTANRFFAGAQDLVLLRLEEGALKAELKWEASSHHPEPFPHLYGPLNLEAVAEVLPFLPDADGRFTKLPQGL